MNVSSPSSHRRSGFRSLAEALRAQGKKNINLKGEYGLCADIDRGWRYFWARRGQYAPIVSKAGAAFPVPLMPVRFTAPGERSTAQ